MRFGLWLENVETITVYHGSRSSGLSGIKSRTPSYEGGLGTGVYVGLYPQTAQFYGQHVYEMRTRFGWDSVLSIGYPDGENYFPIEGMEGHSILVGEQVPPFGFFVKNKPYIVVIGQGWPDEDEHPQGEPIALDQIGDVAKEAGYKAVYVFGIRYGSSVNEEMLVFDANDIGFVREISA